MLAINEEFITAKVVEINIIADSTRLEVKEIPIKVHFLFLNKLNAFFKIFPTLGSFFHFLPAVHFVEG